MFAIGASTNIDIPVDGADIPGMMRDGVQESRLLFTHTISSAGTCVFCGLSTPDDKADM